MSNSNLRRLFTLLLTFTFVFNVSSAQSVTLNNIELAMKSGDAVSLAGYFGSSVDITINKNQNTYSRTQAQMVLRDFFRKNNVQDFDFKHTGNAPANNIIFCVGSLITVSGNYKVYMYLKQQTENNPILREIRIQK